MTCDEVRERLSDHLLGTLSAAGSADVAAHLRGCASCRAEMGALEDGVGAFASAAHDRTPPPELRAHVADVLAAEWATDPGLAPDPERASDPEIATDPEVATVRGRRTASWFAIAAAFIVVVASVSWGLSQRHAAQVAAAQGSSYTNLLHILGGKEFRAGTLVPAAGLTLEGSVVVYDSHEDQSWVAVFVRSPGTSGQASATLEAPDGRTVDIWPLKIQPDGAGSAWVVTSADLTSFNHLTVRDAGGRVIATAQINPA